jgi:hypothetical protein
MILIEAEPFTPQIAHELLPLGQKCWEESTLTKKDTCAFYGERDFAIEPNVEKYLALAANGVVTLITLRENGRLRGYVLGLAYYSLHHKDILCAICDTAYIEPEYRSYGAIVAEKFEAAMRERNVQIIGWPTHVDGPMYALLKARGYVGDDIVMEKRLPCVSH